MEPSLPQQVCGENNKRWMKPILIEVCCGSVEEAISAEAAGADRIELCAALPTGGVTPSLGMLLTTRESIRIPIVAMVRPREGGACPPEPDFIAAVKDVQICARDGADEIICGVLNSDGEIDLLRNKEFIEAAEGKPVAFHRVFDMTADLEKSLDQLIELGFSRVLTSGGKPSVVTGMFKIESLLKRAENQITILPGGGVRLENVAQLIQIGCKELHFSARIENHVGYSGIRDFCPNPERIHQIRSSTICAQ